MNPRWTALGLAALLGCNRPATQIVVRVDSDMREGDELVAVQLTMRRTGATSDVFDRTYDLTAGVYHLPGTLGVVPGDPDDARRLEVDARASLASGDGFTTRALVSFQPEQTLLLDLFLASRCRDPANRAGCGPDETCGPDGCEPVSRPALPEYEPDAARREAAVADEDAPFDDLAEDIADDVEEVFEEDASEDVSDDDGDDVAEDVVGDVITPPPCGAAGLACCEGGRCAGGAVCVAGACAPCGGRGQTCCAGGACGASLTCAAGLCACGAGGQSCCNGTSCGAGLVCSGGACAACGAAGQPCCNGGACAGGTVCSGGRCVNCGANGQPCCNGGGCDAVANPCVRLVCNARSVCDRTARPDGASAGPRSEQRCCNGVEVDISRDARNCGGCGMACGSGSCEPLEAIPCGGSANVSGRCRCAGATAQCPVGRGGLRQVCRTASPYANRCAPESGSACAPGTTFIDVSSCPNFCRY